MASLINQKITRQGLMKKAPSAKKKDEVRRGTWQERWFVLKKTTLYYYKKRGDTRPKGEIDLRAAIVEDADIKTRKEFTIRIQQACQIFNYIQCSSQAQKDAWLDDLKIAAGYEIQKKEEEERVQAKEYYASFGMIMPDVDKNLHRVVLIPDAKKKFVHIANEQQFIKRIDVRNLRKTDASAKPNSDGFYEVKLKICPDPRLPNETKDKTLFCTTADEARSCASLLTNFSQGDKRKITDIVKAAPKKKGFCEIQGLAGKSWIRLWAVLVEKRCILYNSVDDVVPVWTLWISSEPRRERTCGLSYREPSQQWNFRFQDEKTRDSWFQGLSDISKSFEENIAHKLQKIDLDGSSSGFGEKKGKIDVNLVQFSKKIHDSTQSFVVTWGSGRKGQLGNRTYNSTPYPQLVHNLHDKKVRCVDAGTTFALAATHEGQLYTWGGGKQGELGLGESAKKKNYPCLLVSLSRSTSVVGVACGAHHAVALTGNGQVFTWGANESGQLGLGRAGNVYKPKILPFFRDMTGEAAVVQISAGAAHTAALMSDRENVYMWGDNRSGQLGLGDNKSQSMPTRVPGFSQDHPCSGVFCGDNFTMFLNTTGELFGTGANESGQLGVSDYNNHSRPRPIPAENFGVGTYNQVSQVAPGGCHTLAIAGGKLYAWGAPIVNGRAQQTNAPGAPLGEAKYVSAGKDHSLFIDAKFQIRGFGSNELGGLGIRESEEPTGIVTANTHPSMSALSVAAGDDFTVCVFEGRKPETLHRVAQPDKSEAELFANQQCDNLLQKLQNAALNPGAAAAAVAKQEPTPSQATASARRQAQVAAPVAAQQKPKPQKSKAAAGGKKPMWKEVMDPRSGKPYYYHTVTRETRWKRPTDGLPIVKKHT